MVAGEPLVHHAGQKTRCLHSFVELRKSHPELFEDFTVMGQPSGTFDETISVWEVQELSGSRGASELFEDFKTEKLDVAGEMSVPQGAELHKPAEMGAPTIQLPKDAATVVEMSQGKGKQLQVAIAGEAFVDVGDQF